MLGAVASLRHQQVAGVGHLRAVNPHVAASLEEWQASGGVAGNIPRQAAAGAGLGFGSVAGE